MTHTISALTVFAVGIFAGSFLKRCISHALQEKIGRPYLPVELGNGVLYVWVFQVMGWTVEGALFCICASALIEIGIVDQRTYEIPAGCNILIGILGSMRFFTDPEHWYGYLAGMSAASGFLLLIYIATKGKGIGKGDIKLMAAAGLLLGWENIFLALFLGSAFGVVIHTALMALKGKDRVLAFGPYLALGIFIAMLYGERILDWYLFICG